MVFALVLTKFQLFENILIKNFLIRLKNQERVMKFILVPLFWIVCISIIFFLLIHILTKNKRENLNEVIAKITTLPV